MKIHFVTRLRQHELAGVAQFNPEEVKGQRTVADCGEIVVFNPIHVHWSDGRICERCWKKHFLPNGYVNSYLFAVAKE